VQEALEEIENSDLRRLAGVLFSRFGSGKAMHY